MSVRCITWAFDTRVGDHIAKAILVKLADNANDDGICWPKVKQISDQTEIPERTVKRKLAWLESEGFIERTHQRDDGRFSRTIYQLVKAGGHGGLRPGATEGRSPGANARAFLGPSSLEPSEEHPPTPHGNGVMRPNRPTGLMVNRKEAAQWELDLAGSVLDAFNALTGSNPPFTSDGWLKKIIMRIREHPTLDADAHVEVLRRALADPWWDGPASPAVIYGNDTLFEQRLVSNGTTKRKRRYGTGVTAGEMGDLAQRLREAGR